MTSVGASLVALRASTTTPARAAAAMNDTAVASSDSIQGRFRCRRIERGTIDTSCPHTPRDERLQGRRLWSSRATVEFSDDMTTCEVPFDLVEAKLAAPFTRSNTVAKANLIASLFGEYAVGERRRARRLRQDDAPRAVGRGRSAPVRVGRRRQDGRRLRGVPAAHHGRGPRSRARSARDPRRTVASRRSRLDGVRLPCWKRTVSRSKLRWCSCSTICTRSPIRPAWTHSRSCPVRPARVAARDREPRRAGTAACPVAGTGGPGRDRRDRTPAG